MSHHDDVFRSESRRTRRAPEDDLKVASEEKIEVDRDGRDKTQFATQQRNPAPIIEVSSLVVLFVGVGRLAGWLQPTSVIDVMQTRQQLTRNSNQLGLRRYISAPFIEILSLDVMDDVACCRTDAPAANDIKARSGKNNQALGDQDA